MFENIRHFDNAQDPETLGDMFIYQDQQAQLYDQESREVIQEYMLSVIDPLREVARIELKGNK